MGLVQHYPALNRPAAPVCSVCIANYNGVALLADCLESVLSQLGSPSIEIIVHDDASTDDSVALLRKKYPQIELLASTENVGFCISNNRMAAHARGEYILLLNNDAALYPDGLSTLLEAACAPARSGILTLPQYDWTTDTLVDRGCLLDPFYNPVPNRDPQRTDVAMAIGACLFMARELWCELGGFPEWFESIGEDLYICCLARLRGVSVQVTSCSGYRHRQGASFGGNRVVSNQLQTTFRRRRLSERNKTIAMVICTPTFIVWWLLALHLAALVAEGVTMAMIRLDRKIWNEIYSPAIYFACAAPITLSKRRQGVQKDRRATLLSYLCAFVLLPQKLKLLLLHGVPKIH